MCIYLVNCFTWVHENLVTSSDASHRATVVFVQCVHRDKHWMKDCVRAKRDEALNEWKWLVSARFPDQMLSHLSGHSSLTFTYICTSMRTQFLDFQVDLYTFCTSLEHSSLALSTFCTSKKWYSQIWDRYLYSTCHFEWWQNLNL